MISKFGELLGFGRGLQATNTTDPEGPPPFKLPFLEEIGAGIEYSRWFTKTYNVLLVGILVLLILKHQLRRQLFRKPEPAEIGPAHLHSDDDTKPLLGRRRKAHRWCLRLRGILAYQPPNVLNFESPPISTILVLTAYYALNLIYALYKVPFHRLKLFIVADRLGCLFTANLPLLYIAAAKLPLLRILTGWSYERINILHRAVGRVCILAATAHVFGFFWVWYATLQANITLRAYLLFPAITYGLVAYVCYTILGLTSLEAFRARCYEVFLALHVLLQAACLVLLWFHHHNAHPYIYASLLIFIADRIWYRLLRASTRMHGTVRILPDAETMAITLRAPKSYIWSAGDHVFLVIPALELLHPHPFSILSVHTDSELRFLIRAQAGFSRRLLQDAEALGEKDVAAIVDGPYGSDEAGECAEAAEVLVGVAGGSGVAVVYPQLLEFAAGKKRAVFIWVVREAAHEKSWMPYGGLVRLRTMGVEVMVKVTAGARGRPDIPALLEEIAEDAAGRRTGVIVCGPSGMVRDVRNTGARLLRAGFDVDVVTEKFGW